MTLLIETAYAKLNLALHVRRRRDDGYHEMETLFAFCADGDVLTASPAKDLSLDVVGPYAGAIDGDNLVIRAGRAFRDAVGVTTGAQLVLDKMLPVAAGIGGGSADAAAALRLLARLWHIAPDDWRLLSIARALGADVPACVASHTAFGTGRGDDLAPVDLVVTGQPALLVNPRVALATRDVFAAWDGVDRGALDPGGWQAGRNDLEPPARALVPAIGDVLRFLARQPGATTARMSGSGATCFALFDDTAALEAARRAMPESWWVLATTLR